MSHVTPMFSVARDEWVPFTGEFVAEQGLLELLYDIRKAISNVRHRLCMESAFIRGSRYDCIPTPYVFLPDP